MCNGMPRKFPTKKKIFFEQKALITQNLPLNLFMKLKIHFSKKVVGLEWYN